MDDPLKWGARSKTRRGDYTLGPVSVTDGVTHCLTPEEVCAALRRHVCGEFEEVPNQITLVFSTHESQDRQTRFYIITEGDGSGTLVLLPH